MNVADFFLGLAAGSALVFFASFMGRWLARRDLEATKLYRCWDSDCTLPAGHIGPHRGVAEGSWWR